MQENWMIYGATGHTGNLIATRAVECGHRPVLAGRRTLAVHAIAERLGLPHRVLDLDVPAALDSALGDMDLVLNAAGPFLHTAVPLAKACLRVGAHYLDISNELQVFRALYGLDEEARRVCVSIIPGVGFGVVATNCLALYVSDAVGGANLIEVGSRSRIGSTGPRCGGDHARESPLWRLDPPGRTPGPQGTIHRSHDDRLPRRTVRCDARPDRRSGGGLPRHKSSRRRCVRRQPTSSGCNRFLPR